jgi:hypothetical protein
VGFVSGRISIHSRGISIERNGHAIEVSLKGYIDVFIDGHYCFTAHVSSSVYRRLVGSLINGVASDDVVDCLTLIVSKYRSARVRNKYAIALAHIGPSIKKWIEKKPSAYLKRNADLAHIRIGNRLEGEPSKYLLAFFCKNGWIVVDMIDREVYTCIRDDEGLRLFIFRLVSSYHEDLFTIMLAELLPSLKEDLRNVKRLEDCGFLRYSDSWAIRSLLNKIPKEWWIPLDIEALIIEQELRRAN